MDGQLNMLNQLKRKRSSYPYNDLVAQLGWRKLKQLFDIQSVVMSVENQDLQCLMQLYRILLQELQGTLQFQTEKTKLLLLLNIHEDSPLTLVMSFRQLVVHVQKGLMERLLTVWIQDFVMIFELTKQISELEESYEEEAMRIGQLEQQNVMLSQ